MSENIFGTRARERLAYLPNTKRTRTPATTQAETEEPAKKATPQAPEPASAEMPVESQETETQAPVRTETITHAPDAEPRPRGRPPLEEPTNTTSVMLPIRQILYLDRKLLELRAEQDRFVNRSAIIRDLIDALMESGIDITTLSDEDRIELFKHRLKGSE